MAFRLLCFGALAVAAVALLPLALCTDDDGT